MGGRRGSSRRRPGGRGRLADVPRRVVADGPTSSLPAGATVADTAAVGVDAGAITVVARRPAGPSPGSRRRRSSRRPRSSGGSRMPGLGSPRSATDACWRRPLAGDLLITFATPEAAGQVALENRRGLLATRARSDHYVLLARWMACSRRPRGGALDVSRRRRACRRARAGPSRDLRAAGRGAARRIPRGGGPSACRASGSPSRSWRGSAGGLVTDAEYAAKRAQILARL